MHTHVDTHCGLWNMNHIIFHHSSHNWNRCILKTTMPNLKTSRNFWKITLFKSILIKWLSEVVLSCIIQYFFLWKLNNLTRIRGLHSEQFLKLSPNSEISELLLVLKLAFLLYFTVLVDNLWISIKKRSKILWGGGGDHGGKIKVVGSRAARSAVFRENSKWWTKVLLILTRLIWVCLSGFMKTWLQWVSKGPMLSVSLVPRLWPSPPRTMSDCLTSHWAVQRSW